MEEKYKCRICNGTSCKNYLIQEMMFGMKDQFTYWECNNCGCLQIDNYLPDIERYYPENYYSFKNNDFSSYEIKGFKKKLNLRY